MREIVWVMTASEVMYNSQVIECFKPDELDIRIRAYPLQGLSESQLKFSGITLLQEQGYHIQKLNKPDDLARGRKAHIGGVAALAGHLLK